MAIYLVILVSSLVHRWPYNFGLTLKHYDFDTAGGYRSLWNSIRVAALTAVAGTTLCFVGGYVVEKCKTAASGPLYLLSVLPVSVPGMVLGLAYIFTFNAPGSPLNALYGTLAILIISNVIHYFTVGFLTATTALKQMDAGSRTWALRRRALLPDFLARPCRSRCPRSWSACTSF
jgi:iron(III) transport system permease protein